MKPFELKAYTLIRTLGLIGLLVACSFALLQSAPPPSAFGVWDRADKFDPKEYPFLKGFSFDQKWADLEKQPGVFDWSGLDEIIKKIATDYKARTGITATIFSSRPAAGATVLKG